MSCVTDTSGLESLRKQNELQNGLDFRLIAALVNIMRAEQQDACADGDASDVNVSVIFVRSMVIRSLYVCEIDKTKMNKKSKLR